MTRRQAIDLATVIRTLDRDWMPDRARLALARLRADVELEHGQVDDLVREPIALPSPSAHPRTWADIVNA